eukprot:g7382.t1
MDPIRVHPTGEVVAVVGPVAHNTVITSSSLAVSSFLRREKAERLRCYPGASFAWCLLRDVCDWYDTDFTQDGQEPQSPKKSISIRLLLLLVPPLVLIDLILNLIFTILIFPLLFLWCCYPFKIEVITARRNGPPYSCCPLHEGCDPILRVWTSMVLLLSTPLVIMGVCAPQSMAKRMVHWADGHTSGYLYLDRRCLCYPCGNNTQFDHGIFFRNRTIGEVMC